jgi:DNA-binding SARP family transcriptional activator/tetratricopeptide (TPR) repeat protein
MTLRFTVLGPVGASTDGKSVLLPPKERVVLATLLLRAGRVVPVSALVQALWDDTPPPTARNAVQGHIRRLRQLLGPAAARVITRSPGYLVEVHPGELDLRDFLERCDRARAEARDGRWPLAASRWQEALALWSGEALAGAPSAHLLRTEVPQLAESREQARDARVDAELRMGRHDSLVGELRARADEHPLRERLWGQLMLALYRGGRQGDALAAYQQARTTLRGELGVDPGEELRRLHQQILSADPALAAPAAGGEVTATDLRAPLPAPQQLPPDLADFAGRQAQAQLLCGLLGTASGLLEPAPGPRRPGGLLIAVIAGMGGIGKTALAVHAAHQLRDQFPDGQLFVDLQGGTDPLPAADVLARFLRDLSVPETAIPATEAERAARFRSLTAGRRLLIVLDDAHAAGQVRPLLPGTAGCAVLITSRVTLAGLSGATHTDLTALAPAESRALLAAIIGPGRLTADPAGTDGIVTACAGLPLALRIAGSRLASRPSWNPTWMSALLDSEQRRLSELAAGDVAIRTSFEVSYRTLPPGDADPARVFRLLGLADSPTISLPAIAALAGRCRDATAAAMETLLDAHLVTSPQPGRYDLHDLLRLYAAERARDEESPPARHDALRRLLSWYLHALSASVQVLGGRSPGALAPLPPQVPAIVIDERGGALDWLQSERASLIQAVSIAARQEMDEICWQIAFLVEQFLTWEGARSDHAAVCRAGLAAAERSGNKEAIASLLTGLGVAVDTLHDHVAAIGYFSRSVTVWREVGDRSREARSLSNVGLAELQAGQAASAISRFRTALAIDQQLGDRVGVAHQFHRLGSAHHRTGRLAEALDWYRQSLAVRVELAEPRSQATTLHSIGEVLIELGRTGEAMEHLQRALIVCRDNGMPYGEGMTLASLGDGLRDLGQMDEARASWREALGILAGLGAPETEQVRKRLGGDEGDGRGSCTTAPAGSG